MGDTTLPLRRGATLEYKEDLACDPLKRRRMYTAWISQLPGTYVPGVHANCSHNEVRALLARTLAPTPESAESARTPFLDSFRRIRDVCRRYDGSRWELRATAESYTGSLRRRYLEAQRSLEEDGPISRADYFLRAFVKAEKVRFNKFQKPRMIFPRSPRYNLLLASWLKPFEHWLWGNLKSIGNSGVPKSRVVAKGLNPAQRANLIERKMRQIRDCVVFEVDGAAFEAHVDFWQLLQEHSVYETAYPRSGDLKRLLNRQLRNFGVTSCGVKFARLGGRASGDFNTGMGNSLVMLALVDACLRLSGSFQYDTLVDGDNALIFVEGRFSQVVVDGFAEHALRCSGHELVLERETRVLEEVRFGQSAPVVTARGLTMVRDWVKVVSQGTSSHIHLRDLRFASEWLLGAALCEVSLSRGVPILWKWASKLRELAESNRDVRFHPHVHYQMLGVDLSRVRADAVVEGPSVQARESFFRAFGVSPEEQIRLESCFGRGLQLEPWRPIEFSDSEFYLEPELRW